MSDVRQSVIDALRCNRCGFCQEACPTYKVTALESALARGRNSLVRMVLDGELAWDEDPELKEHLYSCLLCGACTSSCPSGIATDQVVAAARGTITGVQGLPFLLRLALHSILHSPRRLAMPMRLMGAWEATGLRWVTRYSKLLNLLGPLGDAERMLPPVPLASARVRLRSRSGSTGAGVGLSYITPEGRLQQPKRRRVAYFLGCITDNLFPRLAGAVVTALEHHGYEVVIPNHLCCGAPLRAYGDMEEAARLAAANVDLLSSLEAERVVVDCATCGYMLREYGGILDDSPHNKKAREIVEAVRDASQLLMEDGLDSSLGELEQAKRVTYHDPCHLARGMQVRSAPREVLKAVPGVDLVELIEADWCCGGAGSYSLTNRHISAGILKRKMDRVRDTQSHLLATSCPACRVQLDYGADKHGLPLRVVHPLEIMASILDGADTGS